MGPIDPFSGDNDMRWVSFGYKKEKRPIKKMRPVKIVPDNEFKVRWSFRNILNQKTFKIIKKFWLDIEWCYKVKYIESGNEHIFTESQFRRLIEQSRFKRIVKKVGSGKEHFNDNELFKM